MSKFLIRQAPSDDGNDFYVCAEGETLGTFKTVADCVAMLWRDYLVSADAPFIIEYRPTVK